MSEQDNNNSLWDLLSPELVTEILTRLPAKPLARFKSVSKHWNSLISGPQFLISYINRPFPSSWVILNRIPQLVPESTRYVTQFQLVEPPNVSPSSINPFKLAAEPVTDPNRSKYPTAILHSSSGLLLCSLHIDRDPHKEHEKDPTSFGWIFEEESLFVVNPVTHEWVPLPKPQRMINKRTHVVFTTRVDPTTGLVDKFMVAEYQPIIGSEFANLLCFSSDNGKWVDKSANYMLGMHFWRAEGSFEFEGKFFWVDLSAGLITWDSPGNDPFVELENKKSALCRFIPLPSGRVKPYNTPGLEHERCISPGGGFIQYIEVFKGDNSLLKLWRLMGCESGSEEWSLKYKVSLNCIERNISFELKKGMPGPCFVHPFEADVVYFGMGDYLFSLNVRTRKVETCVTCVGIKKESFVLPMVLSKWPNPLPKRLYVAYAREQGNECFKSQKFTEAIECYSKSIDLSPNAVAFANRAMAYIKINKFHEAESDCTESMKLDANYFKVYWRRALARKELGYFQGAWEDAECGLKFEPDNKELKRLRDELKSVLEKASCEEPIHDEKGAAKDIDLEST